MCKSVKEATPTEITAYKYLQGNNIIEGKELYPQSQKMIRLEAMA